MLLLALGQRCHSALVCLVKPSRPSSSSSSLSCAALSPSEADPSVSRVHLASWRWGRAQRNKSRRRRRRRGGEEGWKRRNAGGLEERGGGGGWGDYQNTAPLTGSAFILCFTFCSVRPSVRLPVCHAIPLLSTEMKSRTLGDKQGFGE